MRRSRVRVQCEAKNLFFFGKKVIEKHEYSDLTYVNQEKIKVEQQVYEWNKNNVFILRNIREQREVELSKER